jgi:Putative peptidoglycan binding domain
MSEWSTPKKVLALGAAVGTGLLVLHCRRRYREHNEAPVTLDPHLDSVTRKVALASLAHESDPAVLDAFVGFLERAGYEKTAEVVGCKSTWLRSGYGERSDVVGYPPGYEGGAFYGSCPPGTRSECMPPPVKLVPLTSGEFDLVGQWSPGNVIKQVQTMLYKLGYDVPVSGVKDWRTTRAIERYQSLHDLDITGAIDGATLMSLRATTEAMF